MEPTRHTLFFAPNVGIHIGLIYLVMRRMELDVGNTKSG